MNSKGTTIVLGNNLNEMQEFSTNLENLGYETTCIAFSAITLPDIIRISPLAVCIILTEWDDERLNACEVILGKNALPPDIPILALLSENIIQKLSRKFIFADIIILPCRLTEIEFRVARAIYYCHQQNRQDSIIIDEITLFLTAYEVYVNEELVNLTLKEYELLKYLMVNRGRVFTRDSLLNTIWGYDYYGGTRTVDVHIRRIRAKLGDIDETHIKTVRGVGYTFRMSR